MDIPHREVDVFEPLTPSPQRPKRYDDGSPVPPVFLHLYETCPAVRSAVRRDGEVLRSRGFLDEAMATEPRMPLCYWCAVKFQPWTIYGRWWE
jgi:hypothetical protein